VQQKDGEHFYMLHPIIFFSRLPPCFPVSGF
jgi:hypothetical protein